MTLRLAQILVVVAALAGAGFAAVAWTRRVDGDVAGRYARDLRALVALDSRLTAEMLKTRSGIVDHYDHIARTEAALRRLHLTLRKPPRFLPGTARRDLVRGVDASEQTRRDKQQLIERFKSEHSILRNSLRALPTLAGGIEARTAETPEGIASRASLSVLVRDVLLLEARHDEAIQGRVAASLERVAALRSDAAGTADLGLVLRHAQIVADKSREVRRLVDATLAVPMEARARALIAAYERHERAARMRADRDLAIAFLLGLVLVGSIASYVILRLRESAAALRRSSRELEDAIASLRVEQEKQKELTELKSRFVSMTSHEFRTPLSMIVSSSEMLSAYAHAWPREKQEDHLGRIRKAALEMAKMLESILLIGKSDAGMLQLQPEPVDLGEFCREVVEAAEQATGQRGRIAARGPDMPESVVADPNLLRHIVENLLTNALKYSPKGDPVELQVWRDGDELVFDVRDRGIGIPETDQRRLFETFHRGGNVGKIGGTGLGLAIVKRAVDLHRGTVSVQSVVGVGTSFSVRVPCPRSAA